MLVVKSRDRAVADDLLSHNNPCFPCNTAVTNYFVSYTCKIRFHDVTYIEVITRLVRAGEWYRTATPVSAPRALARGQIRGEGRYHSPALTSRVITCLLHSLDINHVLYECCKFIRSFLKITPNYVRVFFTSS